MSNKKRRQRTRSGAPRIGHDIGRDSCRLTSGKGAQPYDDSTLALFARIVPRVEMVTPLGYENETDEDRLSRARGLARLHRRNFGACIRADAITTKYFQELVLGEAHEIHVMRSKTRRVADGECNPYGTIIVVFKPGHHDRIENGLCSIYWEKAAA